MIPQNVTSKYIRNLLCAGSNHHFELDSLKQRPNIIDGVSIGAYFVVVLKLKPTFEAKESVGATPEHAVSRCLERFGVTFR